MSPEELSRIKSVLENSNNRDVEFNLNRDIYTRFNNISNFKRNLKLHLELEKNDAKYKQSGDYFSSLKKAKAGIFYSQNRHGISYEVEENSSWQNGYKDFKKDNREHKVLKRPAGKGALFSGGIFRSEERRVGKECLRLCRSRWSPYH